MGSIDRVESGRYLPRRSPFHRSGCVMESVGRQLFSLLQKADLYREQGSLGPQRHICYCMTKALATHYLGK